MYMFEHLINSQVFGEYLVLFDFVCLTDWN